MYQGLSRGDLRSIVDQLHCLMIGREPDLTVLIDMDPATGLARAKSRQTAEERFEDFGQALQEQMRKGFLDLSKEYADRFRVIDGSRDMDRVAEAVYSTVIPQIEASA
mmetsp:Transcript_107/g.310  ORF Transcript_107/g.310 Transcript_107/m.310 type:complete len:108 (+) Transcript_107:933-1256(+)